MRHQAIAQLDLAGQAVAGQEHAADQAFPEFRRGLILIRRRLQHHAVLIGRIRHQLAAAIGSDFKNIERQGRDRLGPQPDSPIEGAEGHAAIGARVFAAAGFLSRPRRPESVRARAQADRAAEPGKQGSADHRAITGRARKPLRSRWGRRISAAPIASANATMPSIRPVALALSKT
jgi:hypothetical protein